MNSLPCYHCRKECLSELIGTYALVLLGPGTVILLSMLSISRLDALALIALAFGSTVGLVILALGKHSGSVINPAITLAAASASLLKRDLIVPYLAFQMLGGILAGLSLKLIFASEITSTYLGSTALAKGINPVLGIIFESIGTFVLATSALVASTRIRSTKYQGLFVGATLFVLILLIGPLTGAGFNPARSFGPSLASGYFSNLYVYFVGPILGALAAGILFRVIQDFGKRNPVCLC